MSIQLNQKQFTVYTASAGSGKTFSLTIEYLKIALQDPKTNFSRILAITFTRKATNEMKARILEACKAISQADKIALSGRNEAINSILLQETNLEQNQLISAAKLLYTRILHNYSDFAVSTIDSFSQRLIRSFAFELHIPINFEVLLDQSETIEILVNKILALVGGDDQDLNNLIIHFFKEKLKESDSINIKKDLEHSVKIMLQEDSIDAMAELSSISSKDLLHISTKIDERYYQIKSRIKSIGKEAVSLIESHHLEQSDFYGKSAANLFYNIQVDVHIDDKKGFPPTRFANAVEDSSKWMKADECSKYGQLCAQLSSLGAELISQIYEYWLYEVFKKSFPQIASLYKFQELFEQYHREEEVVLISEFNTIINKEIKGQPAPFLYEKLGDKYQYILIDEFQDTSISQWQNIIPLVTESISQNPTNKSLVVGDSKQAIYRWRGGETKQLSNLPKLIGSEDDSILREQEEILNRSIEKTSLDKNYRSDETIVEFNNSLYQFIAENPNLSPYHPMYSSFYQIPFKKNNSGYVELEAYERKQTSRENKESKSEYHNRVFELLLPKIKDAQSRGYELQQMAILCRDNKELKVLAEQLTNQGIQIISKESLSVGQYKPVRAFMSMIELFSFPSNAIVQTNLLHFFQELGLIACSKSELFHEIGSKSFQNLQEIQDWLTEKQSKIDLLSMNQSDSFQAFQLFFNLLDSEIQNTAALSFFMNELWACISIHGNNRELILDWWEQKQDKLYLESTDDINGIHLLTIHKAKGLEFDIVFMPYTNWTFQKPNRPEFRWVETDQLPTDQLHQMYVPMQSALSGTALQHELDTQSQDVFLDNLNLLYVATTRAKSELYIFYSYSKTKKNIEESSNIGDLLKHYTDSQGSESLTFGKPTQAKQNHEEESNKIPLLLQLQKHQIKPIVENKASAIWSEEIREKIDYGRFIHHLLEEITEESELEPALDRAIASGLIDEDKKEEIIGQILTIMKEPDLANFFNPNCTVLSEQSIIDTDGDEFIPDRILVHEENKVELIDFKTGKNRKKHIKQVSQYKELLQEMGYEVERAQLVYLNPFEVVPV